MEPSDRSEKPKTRRKKERMMQGRSVQFMRKKEWSVAKTQEEEWMIL